MCKKVFGLFVVLVVLISALGISTASAATEGTVITEDKNDAYGIFVGTYGDSDGNNKINVKDATNVQKYVAGMISLTQRNITLSNVDGNKDVNVRDATAIQKRLAGISVTAEIGSYLYITGDHTHNYVLGAVIPDCEKDVYEVYSCLCGDEYQGNLVPSSGHNYKATVVAPSCTDDGYTTYKCDNCLHSYKGDYVKSTGHKYTDKVVPATCTAQGYTEHTCSVCKDSYKDAYTSGGSHSYTSKVVAPTCTAQGYTQYTCSLCNASYKDNYTVVANHNYTSKVVVATCTDKGYTLHKCDCGDEYKDNWTNPQHSFVNSYCSRCRISSYSYLVSWIKENGNLNSADGYYRYDFEKNNVPSEISKYNFSVAYYPSLDQITLLLQDPDVSTGTLISIFRDTIVDGYVECNCSSKTLEFGATTAFFADDHIMESPIYIGNFKSETITFNEMIDVTRIYAHYTISAFDYYLKATDAGVTILDFGFSEKYCNFEGKMPFENGHSHSYKKTDDTHTSTESGLAVYTCYCGSEYWINSSHTFEAYECSGCGITPFEYFANWIKENGKVYENKYTYVFTSIYELDGLESIEVSAIYYPDSNEIAFNLFDDEYGEHTMIFLEENQSEAYCIFGDYDDNYRIYTYIDITEFNDNTRIYPLADSWYDNYKYVEYAQDSISFTVSACGYAVSWEVEDLYLYDLGFYSYLD